jgi:hypothetical protein
LFGESTPETGAGDKLAGDTGVEHVNESAPWLPIEGSHVIPDGELGQDSVALALQEDLPAVRLNLDSTYSGMSEKDATEDSAPCSCKKV